MRWAYGYNNINNNNKKIIALSATLLYNINHQQVLKNQHFLSYSIFLFGKSV